MRSLTLHTSIEPFCLYDVDGKKIAQWDISAEDDDIDRMVSECRLALDGYEVPSAPLSDDDKEQLAKVQKRVIIAIAGEDAYEELLRLIGGGTPCDATRNVAAIGDVFVSLTDWLFDLADRADTREAMEAFEHKAAKAKKRNKKK